MTRPARKAVASKPVPIYERIRTILESARTSVARSVNTTQVVANWLVGREIFEDEQQGQDRANYGESLIQELATQLNQDYGGGYSVPNLKNMRQFYREYPQLVDSAQIGYALRSQLASQRSKQIGYAARNQSGKSAAPIPSSGENPASEILHPVASESWLPGQLHPNLSWTHYRTLVRVDKPDARSFYEIESLQNNWSARELERQINSLLFERLAKSKDKQGLLRLATKGQEILTPALGLILCTDKNNAVVKYTLGAEQSQKIFASRYKLHLPTEDELREELRREVRLFPLAKDSKPLTRKPKKP